MASAERAGLYIASPLGFSEAVKDFLYTRVIPPLRKVGYPIEDPWKLTPQHLIDSVMEMPYGVERQFAWRKLNLEIARYNIKGIKRARGVVAILDGVDVDRGTASEIGFAAALGKRILGYRGDFRLSADNESGIVNLQVEGFINLSGGTIIREIDQLAKAALDVFGPPSHQNIIPKST